MQSQVSHPPPNIQASRVGKAWTLGKQPPPNQVRVGNAQSATGRSAHSARVWKITHNSKVRLPAPQGRSVAVDRPGLQVSRVSLGPQHLLAGFSFFSCKMGS